MNNQNAISIVLILASILFAQNTVESIYELGKCDDNRKGEIIYVTEEQREYVCFGKWIAEESASSPNSVYGNANKASVNEPQKNAPAHNTIAPKAAPSVEHGEFTDERDGQKYKTVTIGKQTWMAENLRYKTSKSHCIVSVDIDVAENHCGRYGSLYDWRDVMIVSAEKWDVHDEIDEVHRGMCPNGFHIPTIEEWKELLRSIQQNNVYDSGISNSAKSLKASDGWKKGAPSDDKFGFSILPAGFINGFGSYRHQGTMAYFWTSTLPQGSQRPGTVVFSYKSIEPSFDFKVGKSSNEFSVRCVKD